MGINPSDALTILKQSDALLRKMGIYEQVQEFLKRKIAYPVVLLGASGAGKTALLKSLSGLPSAVKRDDRTDEVLSAKKKLGSAYIEVIDTPGEFEHKFKREAFARELMARRSVGVINVVSYGYHEGSTPPSSAISSDKASEAFLENRRAVELELLKEWVGPICGRNGCVKWILTVVTKADLWWRPDSEQEVRGYYASDTYKSSFSAADDTPHSVKIFSALNQRFYGKAPMSGYYSDEDRENDKLAVVAHILAKASQHG